MREVVTISLAPALAMEVKKAVKKGKYSSKSEFFRELLKMWASEEFLFQDVLEAEKEIKAGKLIKLKSIREIM
ncbi:ribbon-helix-helix protein, CopG family [Candidatus Falkowbacteria bacterium]|nr:ribbon-helix-helix protein, CopG family [Candidatus Falkowbacteria bacterium]